MKLGTKLTKQDITLLETFTKACRHSILAMTTNAQSGHPGGSLGMVDYLALLYTGIVGQTGEPVIVSNGHVSPAVYTVLAEMGYISKKDVVEGFRKIGQPYEGHVTRHVPGVWYGTGPLGAGAGAASGFALAQKIQNQNGKVYCTVGDGETQEGQVYEMMHFAAKYKLNNLILFMDYNQVQLTDALEVVMPFDPAATFLAGGWEVIEVDGHDFQAMWEALADAQKIKDKPVLLLGNTIMGKGVDFMEETGRAHKATWHGKAAKPDQAADVLAQLKLTENEEALLKSFRKKHVSWKPKKAEFGQLLSKTKIKIGKPRLYNTEELTDCRSAYGKALLDLAEENNEVVALTADLEGSVKTTYLKEKFPERHFDAGVAEQQMVSCAGGLSLAGQIPFCSTFGAFLTSRAKDQARVNDINECNVKMVATHCGLSVGEDGPTHQAIDDSGSMLGFFNTMHCEPADPNHCDRIIRFVGSHYGNCYVRMGRHKIPVLTYEDGSVVFDEKYKYHYGRCDVIREGSDVTIAAMGGTVEQAVGAWELLKEKGISGEIVVVSSIKQFDAPLIDSIKKTKRVVTVEDHNTASGLGSQLAKALADENIQTEMYHSIGVHEYQLSGTAMDLYAAAGLDAAGIAKTVAKICA